MKPEHESKINELINTITSTLRVTAIGLGRSGAINEDDYNPDEYVLAKILVSAAMRRHVDDFYPLDKKYRHEVKNLEHF